MEQLINTATPYYYAMVAFCVLALGIISVAIIIFICSGATASIESFVILILGILFFIPEEHFGNIFAKYNEQMTAIVKPIISENYPDATDFYYGLDAGHFTTNDIEYKIQYKKTVNNEEKLIITVKDEQSKDKNTKMLDIPKETKNNESTND
jgi:ABC-type transport system involved in multi-copper enzyme maturation permease subunit